MKNKEVILSKYLLLHEAPPSVPKGILLLIHGQHSQDLSPLNSPQLTPLGKTHTYERWRNLLDARATFPDGQVISDNYEIWRYIYDDRDLTLEQCSSQLGNQIYDSILSRHSTLPIVILAHSYGGLVPFSAPLEKGLVLW